MDLGGPWDLRELGELWQSLIEEERKNVSGFVCLPVSSERMEANSYWWTESG